MVDYEIIIPPKTVDVNRFSSENGNFFLLSSSMCDNIGIEGGYMMWIDELKKMKKESGLTTKEIAERSHLPEPTLEKLFSGVTKDPRLTTMQELVHFFGYTLDDLVPEYFVNKKSPAPAEADTGDKRLDGIIENYHQLNEAGKDDLAKHAEHLTYIPEYKKGKMVHIKVQKSVARMQPGESYEDIPTVDEIAGTIVNSEEDL